MYCIFWVLLATIACFGFEYPGFWLAGCRGGRKGLFYYNSLFLSGVVYRVFSSYQYVDSDHIFHYSSYYSLLLLLLITNI